jgi:hypothetical protein
VEIPAVILPSSHRDGGVLQSLRWLYVSKVVLLLDDRSAKPKHTKTVHKVITANAGSTQVKDVTGRKAALDTAERPCCEGSGAL